MSDKRNFNFDTSQVRGNAVTAFETAKDALVTLQQGKAVLTAVKAGLKRMPGIPDSAKVLLDTPYGDLFAGMLLHTVAPILTASPTIIKAVKCANVAGAAEISSKMTFIQDTIESAISSLPEFQELRKVNRDIGDAGIKEDKSEE